MDEIQKMAEKTGHKEQKTDMSGHCCVRPTSKSGWQMTDEDEEELAY